MHAYERPGEPYLYPYIEQYVDEIVTVTEESIRKAVKMACLYGKLTLEGAGAMPLAALLEKQVSGHWKNRTDLQRW